MPRTNNIAVLLFIVTLLSLTKAENILQSLGHIEKTCINIFNPVQSAKYDPGFFVKVVWGTSSCGEDGTSVGPFTISLYNNLRTEGQKLVYDFHYEIITGV